jgi:hypothetical protein
LYGSCEGLDEATGHLFVELLTDLTVFLCAKWTDASCVVAKKVLSVIWCIYCGWLACEQFIIGTARCHLGKNEAMDFELELRRSTPIIHLEISVVDTIF